MISHKYNNGKYFDEYFPYASSECLTKGYDTAIDIVVSLLVDDGIKSLGHREALLESNGKYIGVSTAKNKSGKTISVLQFRYK